MSLSTPMPVPSRKRARFGRVTKTAVVIIVGGVMVRWAGWPLWQEMSRRRALAALEEARVHIESSSWKNAGDCLSAASRGLPPDDVDFLRVLALFLDKTQGNPALLRSTLLHLKELGQWQSGDSLSLAWTTYHSGNLLAAADAFEILPAEVKAGREGRKLATALAEAQGFPTPEWAESDVEKLIRTHSTGMMEMQSTALRRLWDLTREDGAEALHAIAYLSSLKTLSAAEADTLVERAEAHPSNCLHERLAARSGLMRADPDRRRETLAMLVDRCRNVSRDEQRVFVEWLALEGESTLIRAMLTDETLFADAALFSAYAQSLGVSGCWKDLRLLLTEAQFLPPVSAGRVQLWLAECASHEDPGSSTAEKHLKAYLEVETNGNQRTLLSAAKLAETLGLTDLALSAYDSLAGSHKTRPLVFVEHAAELAASQGMTLRLVGLTRQLCKLRPESHAYRLRLNYLELLLGMNLEFPQIPSAITSEEEPAVWLIHALAAHRLRDSAQVRSLLVNAKGHEASLTQGQKAVLAGLLATDGQAAAAFQIAETLHRSLLLPEERRFLEMAL